MAKSTTKIKFRSAVQGVKAIFVTGIGSSVIFAIMSISFSIFYGKLPFMDSVGFFFFSSIFGVYITLPAAFALGFFVEISKSILQIKKPEIGFLSGLSISIFGTFYIFTSLFIFSYDQNNNLKYYIIILIPFVTFGFLYIILRFLRILYNFKSIDALIIIIILCTITIMHFFINSAYSLYTSQGPLQESMTMMYTMSLCGGSCSAVSWWYLVVKPLRRERDWQSAPDETSSA